MSELVPGKVIERLEQRHTELIDELDALNVRLEEALSSFQRVHEQIDPASASPSRAVSAEAPQ